jgi:hypothetical protein
MAARINEEIKEPKWTYQADDTANNLMTIVRNTNCEKELRDDTKHKV